MQFRYFLFFCSFLKFVISIHFRFFPALICFMYTIIRGFPGGSASKESACKAGELGSIPGQEGRSPGEGNSNPLQYFCLGNTMDRGAWQATAPRVPKSKTN